MRQLNEIVLFSDRDLHVDKPFHAGQLPVYVAVGADGPGQKFYSSGRLEIALKRGLVPYMVTLLPAPLPDHEWFLRLLPDGHALYTSGLTTLESEKLLAAIMAPWRSLYAELGVEWDEACDSPVPAKRRLVEMGVVDGARLSGFAAN